MPPPDLEWRFSAILGDELDPNDIQVFRDEAWSRKWLDDKRYSAISITSRLQKATGQDDFFAKTLATVTTIPHWLYLVRNDLLSESGPSETLGPDCPDILLFVKMEQGVNGFRDTAHGGVLCGLLDETQSTCVEFRRRVESSAADILYTARLDVEFIRPVRTPSTVMVRAWLREVQGRKWYVSGDIVDSAGQVLATSTSLWISPRSDRL